MRAVTVDEAKANRRDDGGAIGKVIVRDFFGRGHQLGAGPQAYLGEQLEGGSEIFAHFHDVDQFQVVVRGSGRFGRNSVGPVTVQYADGFTPYGPIVANDGGLGYFVFRRSAASGGWRMPEFAHLIPGRPGRHFMRRIDDLDTCPAENQASLEALWGPDEDGLAIEVLRLGARASYRLPAHAKSGQHLLVCAGALVEADRILPFETVLMPDAEEAAALVAGETGAIVLVMKFAAPSNRPGSDPTKSTATSGEYLRAVN